MKAFCACMKKEWLAQKRTGRMIVFPILFFVFGIMNPAIAKATPLLMEAMSDVLASSGIAVGNVTVSAMDSWVQFFKNIPMALIVFVVLEISIFTREYQKGTLVLSLTKGLPRHTAMVSKALMLLILWSVGYWFCFIVTYAGNCIFWDNGIAQHLTLSVIGWWIFGVWIISLICLFSAFCDGFAGVLLGVGGVVFGCYLLSLIPLAGDYLPTGITTGSALIYGTGNTSKFLVAMTITALLSVISFTASIFIFNKKQL